MITASDIRALVTTDLTDNTITLYIDMVKTLIEQYCGRSFDIGSVTERVSARFGKCLASNYPISDVTAVDTASKTLVIDHYDSKTGTIYFTDNIEEDVVITYDLDVPDAVDVILSMAVVDIISKGITSNSIKAITLDNLKIENFDTSSKSSGILSNYESLLLNLVKLDY